MRTVLTASPLPLHSRSLSRIFWGNCCWTKDWVWNGSPDNNDLKRICSGYADDSSLYRKTNLELYISLLESKNKYK